MRTFENPANGHRESIVWADGVAAALFGIFYLALKGLWAVTFVWLAAALILIGGMGAPGFIILIPIQIGLACAVPSMLANRYLQRGWKEIQSEASRLERERTQAYFSGRIEEPDPIARYQARNPAPAPAPDTKPCPYCAEDIKAAAIRCKHCQADLSAPPA